MGQQLHRSQELPIFLLFSHLPFHSHAEHLLFVANLRAEQQARSQQDTGNSVDGIDGSSHDSSHSHIWFDWFPYGASFEGENNKRTSDGQVQGRI